MGVGAVGADTVVGPGLGAAGTWWWMGVGLCAHRGGMGVVGHVHTG